MDNNIRQVATNKRIQWPKCPRCHRGYLEYVVKDDPWHDEHFQCSKCDSTYNIFDMEILEAPDITPDMVE